MLKNFRVRNFRALKDFEVEKLGRVNLIVGKNNIGKSTVLEALRVYARNAEPVLMEQLLGQHDENLFGSSDQASDQRKLAYANFFPDRVFPQSEDLSISIGDIEDTDFVRIAHLLYQDVFEETKDDTGDVVARRRRVILKSEDARPGLSIFDGLLVSGSRMPRQGWIEIQQEERYARPARRAAWEEAKVVPLSYVPTQFLSIDQLAELWDGIALTDSEAHVVNALKVLDAGVSGVAFVKRTRNRDYGRRTEAERVPVVKLDWHARPIPLNSMGDGMLKDTPIDPVGVPSKRRHDAD